MRSDIDLPPTQAYDDHIELGEEAHPPAGSASSGAASAGGEDKNHKAKRASESSKSTDNLIDKIKNSVKDAKSTNRRTLSPKVWQKFPPSGRSLGKTLPLFKFGRLLVLFAPPILTTIFILYVAIGSLQKTSKRAEHHDMYSMLPSFEPDGLFYRANLTNVKHFQVFYFKVVGPDDCELPLTENDDGSFFWASGPLWFDVPPAVSRLVGREPMACISPMSCDAPNPARTFRRHSPRCLSTCSGPRSLPRRLKLISRAQHAPTS